MIIQRPIIPITVCLAIGITVGKLASVAFYFAIPFLLIFIFLALTSYMNKRKKAALVFAFAVFLCIGVILISVREQLYKSRRPEIKSGDFAWIEGRIIEPLDIQGGKARMTINIHGINDDFSIKNKKVKALVFIGDDQVENIPGELEWGASIGFPAISFASEPATNPGQFDYGEYLKQKGISLTFYVASPKSLKIREPGGGGFWPFFYNTRKNMIKAVKTTLPEPYSNFLLGITLSRRRELPAELEEAVKKSGTMHLFAASGLHVSIIALFFYGLFHLLRIKGRWRYALVIPPLVFYALLAGMSPSIVRAVIMSVFFLLAMSFKQSYNPLDALFWAGFFMLIINPYNLFSVSFQLSFIAVLGILLLYSPTRKLLPDKKSLYLKLRKILHFRLAAGISWLYEFIVSLVIVSVVAQVSLIPILAYYFNNISIVNIFGNIILIPITTIVLPVGLGGCLLSLVVPVAGHFILSILKCPLEIAVSSTLKLGGLPFATVKVPSFGIVFFTLYYSFLLVLVSNTPEFLKNNRLKFAAVILALSAVFILHGAWRLNNERGYVFFDVEKESIMLVQKKDYNTIIAFFPGSNKQKTSGEFEWKVLPYLRKNMINSVKNLVILGDPCAAILDISLFGNEVKYENIFVSTKIDPEKSREALEKIKISGANVLLIDRPYKISGKGISLYIEPESIFSRFLVRIEMDGKDEMNLYYANPLYVSFSGGKQSLSVPENTPARAAILVFPDEDSLSLHGDLIEEQAFLSSRKILLSGSSDASIPCPRNNGAIIIKK